VASSKQRHDVAVAALKISAAAKLARGAPLPRVNAQRNIKQKQRATTRVAQHQTARIRAWLRQQARVARKHARAVAASTACASWRHRRGAGALNIGGNKHQ